MLNEHKCNPPNLDKAVGYPDKWYCPTCGKEWCTYHHCGPVMCWDSWYCIDDL